MKPEPVSISFGRKTMVEDSSQIFFGDPDPVILDSDLHPPFRAALNAQSDYFLRRAEFVNGIFCIPHEINQNLKCFVFVHRNRRDFGEIAFDRDAMPLEGSKVHAHSVLDEF